MKKIVALLMAILSLTTASATVLEYHYDMINEMLFKNKIMGRLYLPSEDKEIDYTLAIKDTYKITFLLSDSIKSTIQSIPKEYLKAVSKNEKPTYLYVAKEDKRKSEALLLKPVGQDEYQNEFYMVLFFVITNDKVKNLIESFVKE